MSEGLLGQFSLAKEQSDWVEGRERGGEGEDEGEGADSSDDEETRSENETELLVRQSADINRGEKRTKELYTPVRDVASVATK